MNKAFVGILGGTFDPVHNGHIRLAETAYDELNLSKVIFMPAYIPPHKKNKKITDDTHRINMVKRAVEDIAFFEVSDMEIKMQGESYTARTLSFLEQEYSNMVFIVGADSFMSLDKWYHPEIIFSKADIAYACRDGMDFSILENKADEYQKKYNARCHMLHMPDIDISSTDIRERIKCGRTVEDIVPKEVYKYIKENKLYYEI